MGTRERTQTSNNKSAEAKEVFDHRKKDEAPVPRHDSAQASIARGAGGTSPQDHLARLSRSRGIQSVQGHNYILQSQRQYGNRYVQRVLGQIREGEREEDTTSDGEERIQRSQDRGFARETPKPSPWDGAFNTEVDRAQGQTSVQTDLFNHTSALRLQPLSPNTRYKYALLNSRASPVTLHSSAAPKMQFRKLETAPPEQQRPPVTAPAPLASEPGMPKTSGATTARSDDQPASSGFPVSAGGKPPGQEPGAKGGQPAEHLTGYGGAGERALERSSTVSVVSAAAGQGVGEDKAGASLADATPKPAIDSSSAEGLLASLASVPVSGLGQAIGLAKAAAATIQGHEKEAAQAAIPAIDQPTGLPAVAAPKAVKATELPSGQPPAVEPATYRASPPPEPRYPEPRAPLPGSQVSTAAAEPTAEDKGGGSWWSWLTDRLQAFFGSLPTTDPNVSISAGPRQRVDLTGEADPAQSAEHQQASEQTVRTHRTQADAATTADFGENGIFPTLPTGKLRPSYQPAPPASAGGAPALAAPELPAKERAEFDRNTAPWLKEHVDDQLGAYGRQRTVYERAAEEAQEAGKRQLADETNRTRAEQEMMRQQAQTDVSDERRRWQDENRKIQEGFGDKATAKRQEIDRQIGEKVATTHREADAKFEEAEKQAEAEKTKAETEAAEKKRGEESKPRSWWDRVKGAVSSAFNAIRSAITGIFDKLRTFVKGVIEAAKRVVHGLIEAARAAIVGLIRGFGEFVKGLVSIALAAFPEQAAKARAWIDGRVKAATDAVNHAADALKRVADTILDGMAAAIDAALGVLQAAFLEALDVLEKLALLPFQAMEALAKLVAWVAENGQFVIAALKLEGDGGDVIEALKNAIGGLIAEVPGKAYAKLQEFAGQLDGEVNVAPPQAAPAAASPTPGTVIRRQPATAATALPGRRHVSASQHIKGILRHLDKGLDHLKNHWWDELKKVGWNLLWPWPAVGGDLKEIWEEVKAGFEDAYHLRVGKVIDHFLAITQKYNSILGNLYGWFFIAFVLGSTVFGAFFGGAGAIPGFWAGVTIAGTVGEALVAALIATESAVILKSVADLSIGNDTQDEDEEDYGKIGGSTLTIAITLALLLLGEIAAKLAKSIWEGVVGLFKGEKGPEVKVKVEGEGKVGGEGGEARPGGEREAQEVKPEDKAWESKAGDDTLPAAESQKGVVAERTTADGHKIKVLEDGRVFICTTCEELRFKYGEEIKGSEDFQRKLADAEGTADPQAKADKVEALQKELAEARQKKPEVEPPDPDAVEKKSAKEAAREETQKKLDELKGRLDRVNKEKKNLDDEISKISKEIQQLRENKEITGPERKAKIDELNKEQKDLIGELKGTIDKENRLREAQEHLNEALKLERPSLRELTQKAIKAAAEAEGLRRPDGRFLDANTRQPIDGPIHYGHKYGLEHRRLALEAQKRGMNQAQFNDWVNSHPEWFQIESEASNLSHQFEKKGIDNGLDRLPR